MLLVPDAVGHHLRLVGVEIRLKRRKKRMRRRREVGKNKSGERVVKGKGDWYRGGEESSVS